jgi:hypothetical protein
MVSRFSSSGVGPIGLEKLLIHGRERYNFQIEEGTHTWGATGMNHWKLGYKVELSIKLPILYRGKCHGYVGTTATAFHDLLPGKFPQSSRLRQVGLPKQHDDNPIFETLNFT